MTLVLLAAASIAATPISLEAVRRGSRENTQVRIAELERLRAAEQVRLSRAGVLPQVSLGAGTFAVYDTRDLPQTLGSFSLSATVSLLESRVGSQVAQVTLDRAMGTGAGTE